MSQAAGWYTDPTGSYSYRYWDGLRWTGQVNSGGNTGTDPNPLDPEVAQTPPAPGTAAPEPAAQPTSPTVQVTQSGSSAGTIIAALIAVIAVVVLLFVLLSGSDDDASSPTTSTQTEEPEEAPAPTEAPSNGGT